ncbi:hypothetical protein AB1N83_013777 [Pleurotus pulmonarius]
MVQSHLPQFTASPRPKDDASEDTPEALHTLTPEVGLPSGARDLPLPTNVQSRPIRCPSLLELADTRWHSPTVKLLWDHTTIQRPCRGLRLPHQLSVSPHSTATAYTNREPLHTQPPPSEHASHLHSRPHPLPSSTTTPRLGATQTSHTSAYVELVPCFLDVRTPTCRLSGCKEGGHSQRAECNERNENENENEHENERNGVQTKEGDSRVGPTKAKVERWRARDLGPGTWDIPFSRPDTPSTQRERK